MAHALVRQVQVRQVASQKRPEPVGLRAPDDAFHDGERLPQAGPQGREFIPSPAAVLEDGAGWALSGLGRLFQETGRRPHNKLFTELVILSFNCSMRANLT